jgi:hypothetical protein
VSIYPFVRWAIHSDSLPLRRIVRHPGTSESGRPYGIKSFSLMNSESPGRCDNSRREVRSAARLRFPSVLASALPTRRTNPEPSVLAIRLAPPGCSYPEFGHRVSTSCPQDPARTTSSGFWFSDGRQCASRLCRGEGHPVALNHHYSIKSSEISYPAINASWRP